MIDYVGDISRADAELLKELASNATNILEYGSGASTQVLRAYSKGIVTSVEQEDNWIESTKGHLERLELDEVTFIKRTKFKPSGFYDLVFDDGPLEQREEFAMVTWPHIRIGGIFALHDTRTTMMVQVLSNILLQFSPGIECMYVNKDHSNITVIRKKSAEFYEDWNVAEGRTLAQRGYDET